MSTAWPSRRTGIETELPDQMRWAVRSSEWSGAPAAMSGLDRKATLGTEAATPVASVDFRKSRRVGLFRIEPS